MTAATGSLQAPGSMSCSIRSQSARTSDTVSLGQISAMAGKAALLKPSCDGEQALLAHVTDSTSSVYLALDLAYLYRCDEVAS